MDGLLGILKIKIEVPEQVVVLDPNLSQNNAKFASMVEKYKQHHHQTHGNVKMNEVLNVKKDVKKAKNQGMKRKHSEIMETFWRAKGAGASHILACQICFS